MDVKGLKNKLNLEEYPTSPGVYLMKDAKDKVIYVGKAKNLRARLRTYFSSSADERLALPFLLNRVAQIDYFVTANEKEALLLENTMIKKHKPRYNIRLRDDKSYISLKINMNHRYPRLQLVRERKDERSLYFGPFSSVMAVKETLRFIQRIFPLRVCSDREFSQRIRPCLYYQVDKCLAPCVFLVPEAEYHELIKGLTLFFKGKREELIKFLTEKMRIYSKKMEFEKASLIRDKIKAIKKTIEKQKVAAEKAFDLDVIALGGNQDQVMVVLLAYRSGLLSESRHFEFRVKKQAFSEVLRSFLSQYYTRDKYFPPEIITSQAPNDRTLLEDWLTDLKDAKVKIITPQRGEKRRYVELALDNIKTRLESYRQSDGEKEKSLDEVRKKLKLSRLPRRIECFDISNVQGAMAVGAMVSFYDCEPDKSNYRMFKVRTIAAPNDYAMMKEVLGRRYRRMLVEQQALPDLILIDGGKGQLNMAIQVLKELGIKDINVAAIAKGKRLSRSKGPLEKYNQAVQEYKRSTEASSFGWVEEDHIFLPRRKNPIYLGRHAPAMHLLQRIRDEAHRFAITYHRKLRRSRSLRSILDELPGVGPRRRQLLLRHFGSLARIKGATITELKAVSGITAPVAITVYKFFHPKK